MKSRITYLVLSLLFPLAGWAQINTERVMAIGRNALYFEDYVLSIQYFNQVIGAKPYLSDPYFFRGLAKINLMITQERRVTVRKQSNAIRLW